MKSRAYLSNFLKWSCWAAGRPLTFVCALAFILLWCLIGFYAGFSNTWLLIINTIATINASLMVFIIQNTQNRESKALHLKIDELIFAMKEAKNDLMAIEEIEEEELEELRRQLHPRRKS